VLIVDDQEAVREVCTSLAQGLGYRSTGVASGAEALKILEENPADVVVSDIRLPDMSGIELLKKVKEQSAAMPVIMMTAYASVGTAVQAMKLGATDYITKPFDAEEMRLLLQAAVRRLQLETENRVLREQLKARSSFGNLIGVSPQMQRIFRLISKVSQNRYPVLILGESGTGKEVVARAVHYNGPDRDRPFIPVDCGALVPSLIESELFGYVKGAFTGANQNREGLLEVADGGTVFLDEIAELPVDLQAKLLRAIQEKEIRPVGSTRRVRVEVRIIAATNRDLEAAVAEGSFRKDLFFRLNVVSIKLPPLRERAVDIPLLIEHFLEKYNRAGQTSKTLNDEATATLMNYDWPGNVRELENCIERAVALSSGPVMGPSDLPSSMHHPVAAAGGNGTPSIRPIADLERDAIMNALSQLHGDKLLAAKLLGIGKTTLYRKLKEYALESVESSN
jgi:two-component system response regulator HydG